MFGEQHNLYLYGLICTSPRHSLPAGQHLQNLEGQIRAKTTGRHPNQFEEARRTDTPYRTRPATNGATVLGPPGRQVLATRVPEATATEIAERIRRWLVANT